MCELLGVISKKRIEINDLLEVFFSHSTDHKNGWGLALLDTDPASVEKEPVKAFESHLLKKRLANSIRSSMCIAHIRRATIGEICLANTHPFTRTDDSGRMWVLAHNGTVFDSGILAPYQYGQEGTTDSERILLLIVDRINRLFTRNNNLPDADRRIRIVEDAIRSITPGNKINLMIYDSEFFYVHHNEPRTLYTKKKDDCIIISTQPLGITGWDEVPRNRLLVYKEGELIHLGQKHDNTYIHDERKMRMLYFEYSGL